MKVKIYEDTKIPGTDIILEAGDEIEVLSEYERGVKVTPFKKMDHQDKVEYLEELQDKIERVLNKEEWKTKLIPEKGYERLMLSLKEGFGGYFIKWDGVYHYLTYPGQRGPGLLDKGLDKLSQALEKEGVINSPIR
jgi:hypothetical protein